jgi:hypothetical protein
MGHHEKSLKISHARKPMVGRIACGFQFGCLWTPVIDAAGIARVV